MRALVVGLLVSTCAAPVARAQIEIRQGGGPRTMRLTMGGALGPFTEAPASYGVSGWRVGQWARYAITVNTGAMPLSQVRTVSVVGQRGEQFWVEVQDELTGMMQARPTVRKMLIPFGAVRERVGTEVYALLPDSSVRRETLVRAGSGGGSSGEGSDFTFPQGWQRVGEEQVPVAAGAIRAVHWRKGNDHLWTNAEVGPIGIVKFESSALSIELGSRGADARSKIPYGG